MKNPKKTTKKQVLLVDDHPILRQGLAFLINQEENLQVCAELSSASEALKYLQKNRPDIIILDLTLAKGMGGLELMKQLKSMGVEIPILVLSMHDENIYAERALRAGAKGYVMKEEASEKVIDAIEKILNGGIFFSEQITAKMLHQFSNKGQHPPQTSPVEKLSDRELEVFTLLGEGKTTKQIAQLLCLSVKTIETYRANIKEKLGIANSTELLKQAIEWNQKQKGIL
ncbi:MAG: DNA-binding response regulator [Planctomycetota bacterium]|nr:MAG: DNA-binding response regulator [Planctomycetota bacterium]